MLEEITPTTLLTQAVYLTTFLAYPLIALTSAYTSTYDTGRKKLVIGLYHCLLGWVCWAWIAVVIGSAGGTSTFLPSMMQVVVAIAFGLWSRVTLPRNSTH